MRKKVIGILVVGLVLALVIPVGSSSPQNIQNNATFKYESKLFAIGVIRIDNHNYEIRGFVVFGINDGEFILLKNINIKYDGATPVYMGSVLPFFVHHVWYNPAE